MIDFGAHPDLLARLDEDTRRVLVEAGRRRTIAAGELLFETGDPHSEVFIILKGRVQLFYGARSGRALTFAYWQDGAMVGSTAAHDHSWSGRAVSATQLLAIRRDVFAGLLHRHHALALAVIETMEFKTRALASTMKLLAMASVGERLRSWLAAMMELYGHDTPNGLVIRAGFTHQEIAEMIGASRQWVTAELGVLRRQGLIEQRKGEIAVLKPAALRAASSQQALSSS